VKSSNSSIEDTGGAVPERPRDLDTGVVRVVTLDEALAAAKAGRVFVLKACA
jgi:hypothetical protein